ncbi:CocE/NonD family hydrolase C-terminal non-catalytic domain-containing protein [Nocardia sp. NPDC051321]|uniref:CocE/NonD family hydrolase C-terminal non-catalytic domain-containing protein n=1 Tax=Nocardia sp. NPDC051321 TaxID=3364323 RepID=UPI0037AE871A
MPARPLAGLCSASTAQALSGLPAMLDKSCVTDQRANDMEGLTYDLPVAETPLHLAGAISAHLVVGSRSPDGIVVVRVEDVAPDGAVIQLSSGVQRLSLRELDQAESVVRDGMIVRPWHPFTRESQAPMPIDQPVEVEVEVFPTGAVIQPGHRPRLAIQNSDFPHVLGDPHRLLESSDLDIHHGPQRPSWIAIPVRTSG